ncbi:MAG: pyridoxal phosphate-dependent aminotransferase [Proteobacteria bacterium]|nr:pyridoxal phosphate-dependent aminotransferase [Pseudomonadota bacterium]
MPRPPHFAPALADIPGAVYSPFADRLRDHPGPLFPLHVGDTWMEPFEGGRMEDLGTADHPGMHRYSDTRGIPELLDGILEKVRARNGLDCERDSVLVGAGATGSLATAVGAIAAPGEEVLILAPFWPLIRGIVQSFRATPVEVPFYDRVHSPDDAVAAVRERLSPRSVALYVSTPSNPTGCVLPEDWLVALADLARREDLWLLSDEVYEDYVYRGEHVSLGRFAPERTVSVYSFSKAYGMSGNRVGYLVAPPSLAHEARKIGTHTFYHAPTAAQIAAARALRDGGPWIANAFEEYRRAGEATAEALGQPPPHGSTFLFLDVESRLDERGLDGFLEDCFEDGVLVAPGGSSGSAYSRWIRLCYTSVPPDQAAEAARRLAKRFA